jgi:hypothetical protein
MAVVSDDNQNSAMSSGINRKAVVYIVEEH